MCTARLLATASAVLLSAAPAAAQMTEGERQRLVAHFEMTNAWLESEVTGLSDAQLTFRMTPESWSIMDVVEHLAIAEPQYWKNFQDSLAKPVQPGFKPRATDEAMLWYGIDRTRRTTTGDARAPKGTYPTVAESLAAFQTLRAEMLQFAKTSEDDLRGRPYMTASQDLYQWLLMISTHSQRHIMQIREIKAHPGYPKMQIDHIILGINDLERGVAEFEAKTGVRPVFGGVHPGRGTHNALASLGGGTYIEILALNPAEARTDAMTAGLEKVTSLTPIGWALSATDLADVKQRAEAGGVTTTQVMPGARNLPDGSRLEWTTIGVTAPAHDWAPFFIQWGDPARQPARTAPGGCTLESVALADPSPDALRTLFGAVGFGITVSQADKARMTVTLKCPKGTVTF